MICVCGCNGVVVLLLVGEVCWVGGFFVLLARPALSITENFKFSLRMKACVESELTTGGQFRR